MNRAEPSANVKCAPAACSENASLSLRCRNKDAERGADVFAVGAVSSRKDRQCLAVGTRTIDREVARRPCPPAGVYHEFWLGHRCVCCRGTNRAGALIRHRGSSCSCHRRHRGISRPSSFSASHRLLRQPNLCFQACINANRRRVIVGEAISGFQGFPSGKPSRRSWSVCWGSSRLE